MIPASIATPADLAEALASHRYNITTEFQLQAGIEQVLDKLGVTYDREVRVEGGRLDFLALIFVLVDEHEQLVKDYRIGLELKIGGSRSALVRQLSRYALGGDVDALIAVTTRRSHDLPGNLHGIPLHRVVARVWGAL